MGLYIFLSVITICILIDLIIAYKVIKKNAKRTRYLAHTLLVCAVLQTFYTASIMVDNFTAMKILFAVFLSLLPVMLFLLLRFFDDYLPTKKTFFSWLVRVSMFVLTIADVIMQLINPFTEIAGSFRFHENSVVRWIIEPKPIYYLHIMVCYFIVVLLVIHVIHYTLSMSGIYRKRMTVIAGGIIFVSFLNGLIIPLHDEGVPDYSLIGCTVLGLFVYYDMFYNRQTKMLDHLRKIVVDELQQPMILFGDANRIALCNEAAKFLVPDWAFGNAYRLVDFLERYDLDRNLEFAEENCHFQWNYTEENGYPKVYRVDFSVMRDKREDIIGRLFIFTDLSIETDILTGFYTRNAYEAKFNATKTSLKAPVAVAACDINRLAWINKEYGEAEGDRCIQFLAKAMRKYMPLRTQFVRLADAKLLAITERTTSNEMHNYLEEIEFECENRYPGGHIFTIQSAVCMTTGASANIMDAASSVVDTLKTRKLIDKNSGHTSLLDSFAQTLYESDQGTEAHVRRTQALGSALGKRLGFSDKQLSQFSLLCVLHDIGKLGIPLEILNKPAKLTPEEWEIMKTHPIKGYRIAKASPELSDIAKHILHHHERWDGKGYPSGLEGENIPLLARVVCIVDAYDAMVSTRPYHEGMPPSQAVAEIKRCAGTQFDPKMAEEFIRMLKDNYQISCDENEVSTSKGEYSIS